MPINPLAHLCHTAIVLAFIALSSIAARGQEAPAPPAENAQADLTIFGEAFLLRGSFIDIQVEGNAVKNLDARQDVILEMEQFIITAVRLTYDDATKTLHAYGDHRQRCVVDQDGALTFCTEFIYNTETGNARFIGAPEIRLSDGARQQISVQGDSASIAQSTDGSQTRLIVSRNFQIRRDFDPPDATSLSSPLARNSTLTVTRGEGPRPLPIADPIPADLLTRRFPPIVVPITPETVNLITDGTHDVLLRDIKPEEPRGGRDGAARPANGIGL